MRELYSKITLYEIPFHREDNFHLEDISSYLANKPSKTFNGMTAYPISADKIVRIPLEGAFALEDMGRYNYCSIENFRSTEDGEAFLSKHFYWILETKWKANRTIELSLEIDSINSLLESENLGDYLAKETMISRQHEARFVGGYIVGTTERLIASVDKVDEGFSPLLYKKSDETIFAKELDDSDKSNTFALAYCRSGGMNNSLSTVFSLSIALIPSSRMIQNSPNEYIAGFEDIDFSYTAPRNDKDEASVVDALYKIIEFPYSPFRIKKKTTGGYLFYTPNGENHTTTATHDIGWSVTQRIPYSAYADLVSNVIENKGFAELELNDSFISMPIADYANLNKARFVQDTKLLGSAFTSHRFVYDTFSYEIAFERCVFSPTKVPMMTLDFIVGTSMQSTFGFRFNAENFERTETNDYPEVFMIRRNNEMPLVNDEYRNYLNLGYNYDQKSKAIDNITRWTNFAGRTIGNVVGGSVKGGATLAGALINVASDTINTIAGQQKAEIASEQRLANAAARGISVAGSDDIGLLDGMLTNKLRYIVHGLSPEMEKSIDDLFYYYGYSRGYQGIPNAKSRQWFNFVQADVKWKWGKRIQHQELWTILARKFAEGITFFHKHDGITGDDIDAGYNLQRTRENWEVANGN